MTDLHRAGFATIRGFVIACFIAATAGISSSHSQTSVADIEAALQNVTVLVREGKVGYATVWDGNKFVQCRRLPDSTLRCEAAGTLMQPSLASVLSASRIQQLTAEGWTLTPTFGTYSRDFSPNIPTATVADQIRHVLIDIYGASPTTMEMTTAWIVDMPCPPRNGFSQNLAGMINDAPSMRAYATRGCSFTPKPTAAADAEPVASAEQLIAKQGTMTAAEIQRLRINLFRKVYVIFDAGIGYVQCAPEASPPAIYCEAQSAESWPALAAILTPTRIDLLKRAGFAEPGRAPNYSRSYAVEQFNDAAIAREILTILYEVYGYTGAVKLKIKTE